MTRTLQFIFYLALYGSITLYSPKIHALGAGPAWWTAGANGGHVIDSESVPNNAAIATVGQGKWMATRALETLQGIVPVDDPIAAEIEDALYLVPGTGDEGVFDPVVPSPLPSDWNERQLTPLRIGELKALALPFYQKLDSAWIAQQLEASGLSLDNDGVPNINEYYQHSDNKYYPWPEATQFDEGKNNALVSIAQLKLLFSLDFETLEAGLEISTQSEYLYGTYSFISILSHVYLDGTKRTIDSNDLEVANIVWELSEGAGTLFTTTGTGGALILFDGDTSGTFTLTIRDVVTGLARGSVTSEIGTEAFSSYTIKVADSSLEWDPFGIRPNESVSLKLIGTYVSGTVRALPIDAIWSSSQGVILGGVFTAPASASAEITITATNPEDSQQETIKAVIVQDSDVDYLRSDSLVDSLAMDPSLLDVDPIDQTTIPSDKLVVFSDYNKNGVSTWNALSFHHPTFDLSGVCFSRFTSGVLIHDRIALTSYHEGEFIPLGQKVFFVKRGGGAVERTISAKSDHIILANGRSTDLMFYVLDQAVPTVAGSEGVSIYRLPRPLPQVFPEESHPSIDLPMLATTWHGWENRLFGQGTTAGQSLVNLRKANRFTVGTLSMKEHPDYTSFFVSLIQGDSSFPDFFIGNDGELFVASTHTGGFGGSGPDLSNQAVQEALAEEMDRLLPGSVFSTYVLP